MVECDSVELDADEFVSVTMFMNNICMVQFNFFLILIIPSSQSMLTQSELFIIGKQKCKITLSNSLKYSENEM